MPIIVYCCWMIVLFVRSDRVSCRARPKQGADSFSPDESVLGASLLCRGFPSPRHNDQSVAVSLMGGGDRYPDSSKPPISVVDNKDDRVNFLAIGINWVLLKP